MSVICVETSLHSTGRLGVDSVLHSDFPPNPDEGAKGLAGEWGGTEQDIILVSISSNGICHRGVAMADGIWVWSCPLGRSCCRGCFRPPRKRSVTTCLNILTRSHRERAVGERALDFCARLRPLERMRGKGNVWYNYTSVT